MGKNNKLISEFMGWKLVVDDGDIQLYQRNEITTSIGCLNYNEDWGLLMSVVEKIEILGYGVTIGMGSYCVIQDDWKESGIEIIKMTDNSKLLCTYGAVINFIKWYNMVQ